MSTSRFGDAEWGEQFERDDDELVDWPATDADLEAVRSVGVAGAVPASDAEEVTPEPVNFCDESDCPSITEDSRA